MDLKGPAKYSVENPRDIDFTVSPVILHHAPLLSGNLYNFYTDINCHKISIQLSLPFLLYKWLRMLHYSINMFDH